MRQDVITQISPECLERAKKQEKQLWLVAINQTLFPW
jgi:hypothetical protein